MSIAVLDVDTGIEQERLKSRIEYLNREISVLCEKQYALTQTIRFKNQEKCDLEYELRQIEA